MNKSDIIILLTNNMYTQCHGRGKIQKNPEVLLSLTQNATGKLK